MTDQRYELRELQDRLEQSEARFRDVIEHNADAILVIDREGVVRFANREAHKLFEDSPDLVGSTFGFPVVAGETTELDLVHNRQPVAIEMRVVESHWEGELACIATLRNITQRKIEEQHERELIRAQTARASAEEAAGKFRFLAESTAILSASLEHTRIFSDLGRLCVDEIADWAVLFARSDGEFRRVHVVHCEQEKSDLAQRLSDAPFCPDTGLMNELLRDRAVQRFERIDPQMLERLIPDTATRDIAHALGIESAILVPMVAHDRVLGAIALVSARANGFTDSDVALARDLATRAALAVDNARLYDEARQANQAKTELLAVISHDLRTPLNSIIGYGQLLQLGIPEALPPAAANNVDRMLSSARHQLYLIDELLQFARLEAQHETVEVSDTDVDVVIRDAVALIEPVAHAKGLQLRVSMADGRLVQRTDANKLRQVLINLLANAVKYTQSGEVSVEAFAGPSRDVTIRVNDTGIGISEDHLPHIFEAFWQVDPAQRARDGGTGLGLAVVKRVVELLGGRVSARSALGAGTTFELSVPASDGAAAA